MLLWGTLFPVVKLGYSAYNVATTGDIIFFAGVRFTICGALICLYACITDKTFFKDIKKALVPVLLSGLFAIILHYSFTYSALKLTDSSKTAILKQVGVLFYVCFSFMFFKEDKLTVKKLIGVIFGFAGIIAINTNADGISFNIGDVLIIAASFCTVFSNVISKKVFKTVKFKGTVQLDSSLFYFSVFSSILSSVKSKVISPLLSVRSILAPHFLRDFKVSVCG